MLMDVKMSRNWSNICLESMVLAELEHFFLRPAINNSILILDKLFEFQISGTVSLRIRNKEGN